MQCNVFNLQKAATNSGTSDSKFLTSMLQVLTSISSQEVADSFILKIKSWGEGEESYFSTEVSFSLTFCAPSLIPQVEWSILIFKKLIPNRDYAYKKGMSMG